MSAVEKFRLSSILFGVLETVASLRQPISLTFRGAARQATGLVALEGGLVRFGVQVEGVVYLDETFIREAGAHASILTRYARGEQLSSTEKLRLQSVPLAVRRALRAVTARALRKIALLSDLSQIQTADKSTADKLGGSVSLLFSPVELMLAGGCSRPIRYTDLAVRLYEAPPELVQERWLFEWQPDPAAGPWPIMTTRMAERKTSTIAQFGQLGQRLAKQLQFPRLGGERRPLVASILSSKDYAYYLVSTNYYLTLLMYQVSHIERLLKSLETLVYSEDPLRPGGAGGIPFRPPTPLPMSAARSTPTPALPAAPALAPLALLPATALLTESSSTQNEAAAWLEAVAALPEMAEEPQPPAATTPASVVPVPAVPAVTVGPAVIPEDAPASADPDSVPDAPEPQAAPLLPGEPPEAASAEPATAGELSKPVLEVRGLSAHIAERMILKQISLQIGGQGIYALMGPGGSGKSSLLGILSGRNRAGSGWKLEGEVLYQGAVLGSAARPSVVEQRPRHPAVRLRDYLLGELGGEVADSYAPEELSEQLERLHLPELGKHLNEVLGEGELRLSDAQWGRLAIARELISNPPLLCVDEPTAGLTDEEARLVLSALQVEGQRRAVLMVTHHQQQARDYSDHLILLAGGCVQEYRPTAAFYAQPESAVAQDFVRTGGCAVPSPDASPDQLETSVVASALEDTRVLPSAVPIAVAAPAALPPGPTEPAAASSLPAPAGEPCALALRLRGFGLQLGGRVLLSDIHLEIAPRGVHLLVTSSATDKRMLLRALCGPRPSSFMLLGDATYEGRPLADGGGPVTPFIDARLAVLPAAQYLVDNLPQRGSMAGPERATEALALLEQAGWPELGDRLAVPMCDLEPHERRVLEILGSAAAAPALLILDEPLAGVGADELPRLLQLLRQQATQRALLLLVHEVGQLPAHDWHVPARVSWLVEGRVMDSPPESAARPALGAPAALAPAPVETPPPKPGQTAAEPAIANPLSSSESAPRPSQGSGPRGFRWLRQGLLAGMPAPGLTNELDYDLGLIRAAGIRYLITLTVEPPPIAALHKHGIQSVAFPIADMDAPTFDAAAELTERVAALLAQGLPVGFHCKAGLGRTGTMLAAQLIWEGAEAGAALAQVRRIESSWVQSDKQELFLFKFQSWLQQRRLLRLTEL